MDDLHPMHQIPALIEDILATAPDKPNIMAIAKAHEIVPPEVTNYQSARNWLARPGYAGGPFHRTQMVLHMPRRPYGTDRPPMQIFIEDMQREFLRLGIPVHCMRYGSESCDIGHSTMGRRLPGQCWDIFGHIGRASAIVAGLPLLWGGEDGPHEWKPWEWTVRHPEDA